MRELIRVPRKLIKVEAEKHWYESDGFGHITIETDKGTYTVSGCPNCSAVFWRKLQSSTPKANQDVVS